MNRVGALPKLGVFDSKDPEALARALALYEGNVTSYLRDRAASAFGPFEKTSKQTATYTARPWQIVRVNPTAGPVGVVLPAITAAGVKDCWIGIKNASASTNLITVTPIGAKVDGGATIVLSTAWQFVMLYQVDDGWESASLV